MLRTDSAILKPLNFSEWLFYENLTLFQDDPALAIPAKVFPKYIGRIRLRELEYLMLENLCVGMDKPSILDLKMGGSSAGHTKSGIVKKVKQAVVKAVTTSSTLGFRLAGLKIWKSDQGVYDEKDKKFGLSLTAKTMIDALRAFLTTSDKEGCRKDLAKTIVDKLNVILDWMKTQTHFSFNSSSILILHDKDLCEVRMIDFAHCYVLPGADNKLGFIRCKTEQIAGSGALGGTALLVSEEEELDDSKNKSAEFVKSPRSGDFFRKNQGSTELKNAKSGEISNRKKSAQMVKLQGSVDAVIASGEPRVDQAYVQGMQHLIALFQEIISE